MLVLPTFAAPLELHTRRCILRQWKDADLAPWVAMNADSEVRRYFPNVASEEQALAEAQRCRDLMAQRGWGMWALEVPGTLPFAGFVGLNVPHYDAPFVPAVEIGWRLPRAAWGQGLATESALAALRFAFTRLAAREVVAITVPGNAPSRRVMERLGMLRDEGGDFDHPRIDAGHPLRRHVLYRVAAPVGESAATSGNA
ncbi:MAG: GNAT family N-acetyltransferase [Pseudomonadota bacterium]